MPDNDLYTKEPRGTFNGLGLIIAIAVLLIVGVVIYLRWPVGVPLTG